MRRYQDNTPREMTAKFASKCGCGKEIKPGDKIMYYPGSKRAACEDCSYQTRCELADERGGY